MLVLTRLKGQVTHVTHRNAAIDVKYASSSNGALTLHITGDLHEFQFSGFINTRQDRIEAIITRDACLDIARKSDRLRVVLNYIRPERASIGFGGPQAFKIQRDNLNDPVPQA